MKKLFFTIAVLVAIPIFSHQNSRVTITENVTTTVCVPFKVVGAGPNEAYFYSKDCALTFISINGGNLFKGNYCVDEDQVFICL
ncbi:MAG: hypothetical protein L6Q46_09650 [Flavobacterium sp.]|uniref:hypothetical protein n=1 Tax=Flavobacterium sp. TaxID=239 RepID=UPI0025BA16D0|nr:hypothetical protein [Flavobacterium sp.]MCK6608545.1 hypothetical protein [Flavobacterium sp.]